MEYPNSKLSEVNMHFFAFQAQKCLIFLKVFFVLPYNGACPMMSAVGLMLKHALAQLSVFVVQGMHSQLWKRIVNKSAENICSAMLLFILCHPKLCDIISRKFRCSTLFSVLMLFDAFDVLCLWLTSYGWSLMDDLYVFGLPWRFWGFWAVGGPQFNSCR